MMKNLWYHLLISFFTYHTTDRFSADRFQFLSNNSINFVPFKNKFSIYTSAQDASKEIVFLIDNFSVQLNYRLDFSWTPTQMNWNFIDSLVLRCNWVESNRWICIYPFFCCSRANFISHRCRAILLIYLFPRCDFLRFSPTTMTIELNLKIHKSVYHSEKVLSLIFFLFFSFRFFLQILKPMGKICCFLWSERDSWKDLMEVEVGRANGS